MPTSYMESLRNLRQVFTGVDSAVLQKRGGWEHYNTFRADDLGLGVSFNSDQYSSSAVISSDTNDTYLKKVNIYKVDEQPFSDIDFVDMKYKQTDPWIRFNYNLTQVRGAEYELSATLVLRALPNTNANNADIFIINTPVVEFDSTGVTFLGNPVFRVSYPVNHGSPVDALSVFSRVIFSTLADTRPKLVLKFKVDTSYDPSYRLPIVVTCSSVLAITTARIVYRRLAGVCALSSDELYSEDDWSFE